MDNRGDDFLPDDRIGDVSCKWKRNVMPTTPSLACYEMSALQSIAAAWEIPDCSDVGCGDPSACTPYAQDIWRGRLAEGALALSFNVQRSLVRVTVPLGLRVTRRCFKQRLRNTVVPKSEGSTASAPLYLEFGALYTNCVPLCA